MRRVEAEGDLAIGYTCFHAPEVPLNLGNCFGSARAPHTNSMELATYYMANNSCEVLLGAAGAGAGGANTVFHAMAGVDVCEANNRAIENMEIMHMQGEDKEKFFYCNLDIPYSDDEDCVEHIQKQVSPKDSEASRKTMGWTPKMPPSVRQSKHNEVSVSSRRLGNCASWTFRPSPAK